MRQLTTASGIGSLPARCCPFLQPSGWRTAGSVNRDTTCSLSPFGQGPPSADELAWLCTDDHHYGCPRYRTGRGIAVASRKDGLPVEVGR